MYLDPFDELSLLCQEPTIAVDAGGKEEGKITGPSSKKHFSLSDHPGAGTL